MKKRALHRDMTEALDGNGLLMIKIQQCRKWAFRRCNLVNRCTQFATARTTNLVCETLDWQCDILYGKIVCSFECYFADKQEFVNRFLSDSIIFYHALSQFLGIILWFSPHFLSCKPEAFPLTSYSLHGSPCASKLSVTEWKLQCSMLESKPFKYREYTTKTQKFRTHFFTKTAIKLYLELCTLVKEFSNRMICMALLELFNNLWKSNQMVKIYSLPWRCICSGEQIL